MTKPSVISKEFSSSHGDRLIRVQVGNQQGNRFHALTFPEREVQGVAEMGQDRSAILLRSGTEIPGALLYEQLEQKIYEPVYKIEGPVLDLRAVTGEAAKPKAANANEAPAEPKVGDKMTDGTVFAGISPDTNKPMYATPADASLTMTFNEAQEYATKHDGYGHKDWHLPTKVELNVLFNNRAAIGGFNVTDSSPAICYWSASPLDKWTAWCQRFSDGAQNYGLKNGHRPVRPVR
jgi:hypothetical protein